MGTTTAGAARRPTRLPGPFAAPTGTPGPSGTTRSRGQPEVDASVRPTRIQRHLPIARTCPSGSPPTPRRSAGTARTGRPRARRSGSPARLHAGRRRRRRQSIGAVVAASSAISATRSSRGSSSRSAVSRSTALVTLNRGTSGYRSPPADASGGFPASPSVPLADSPPPSRCSRLLARRLAIDQQDGEDDDRHQHHEQSRPTRPGAQLPEPPALPRGSGSQTVTMGAIPWP